jgi:spore germination protein
MIKDNDRISTWQTFVIIISAINAIEVIIFPRQLAATVGPDGWLPLIGGHLIGAMGLFFIISLGRLYPEETFADYTPKILGNFFGVMVVLLAVSFWLLTTARITRQFADFMRLILDQTPIEVIIISILLVAAYIARHGLEPIARVVEILFPIFVGLVGLLIIIVAPGGDYTNLRPFLNTDIKSLISSTIDTALGIEGEEIIIMLLPFMVMKRDAFKVGFGALGLNMVLRLIIFVVTIAVFGVELTKSFVWPLEELGRSVAFPGQFFGRLDAFFIALWVTAAFTSILIFYYLASLAFSRLLKFREHTPAVLPFLPIIFILSLVPNNIVEVEKFSNMISWVFGILVFVIPPFLILISYLRGTYKQQAGR